MREHSDADLEQRDWEDYGSDDQQLQFDLEEGGLSQDSEGDAAHPHPLLRAFGVRLHDSLAAHGLLEHQVQFAVASAASAASGEAGALALALSQVPGVRVMLRTSGLRRADKPSAFLRQLQHTFIVCANASGEEVVVEPAFRSLFSLGQPTRLYTQALALLPEVFVGSAAKLRSVVALVAQEVLRACRAQGAELPPWRSLPALMSRWQRQGSHDTPVAPPPAAPFLVPGLAAAAAVAAGSPVDGRQLVRAHLGKCVGAPGGARSRRAAPKDAFPAGAVTYGFAPAEVAAPAVAPAVAEAAGQAAVAAEAVPQVAAKAAASAPVVMAADAQLGDSAALLLANGYVTFTLRPALRPGKDAGGAGPGASLPLAAGRLVDPAADRRAPGPGGRVPVRRLAAGGAGGLPCSTARVRPAGDAAWGGLLPRVNKVWPGLPAGWLVVV